MPVIAMAMVPALQFPNWQWLSLTLAAPVVVWGGWPFHEAAWANLRHRTATMDTLISVGTPSLPNGALDTRALEQTYLARGQAERVAALRSELEQMKSFVVRAFSAESPIGLGALLRSEDDEGEAQLYLLAPAGAGEILTCELGAVRVVTPRSPLGRALVGARLGDDIEIRTPSGKRTLSITSLC